MPIVSGMRLMIRVRSMSRVVGLGRGWTRDVPVRLVGLISARVAVRATVAGVVCAGFQCHRPRVSL